MLGTSKQVKWAREIRDSKIDQIEAGFQELNLFPAEQISAIQTILEAQEDAGWWIDNRDLTSHSLMLWAANHARLIPGTNKVTAATLDSIYPLFLPKNVASVLDQQISSSWIAVIDNEEPLTSKSEVVNWRVIEQVNEQELEPTFYLSRQPEVSNSQNSQPLYRLLQQQDGGWSMKGWCFLTICRYPDGKFYIEGVVGELIVKVSFFDELCRFRLENE